MTEPITIEKNIKSTSPISVLVLAGCYPSEEYLDSRIQWLEKSLQDLSVQTLYPSEVIISLNNTVYDNQRVLKIINEYIPLAKIIRFQLPRSGSLNFETLLQMASSDYVCFWSDHDRHSPHFLEETYSHIIQQNVALACPIIHYIYEDESLYDPEPTSLLCSNTAQLDPLKSFSLALASDHRGSIYGLWRRSLFKKISIFGHESIDILLVLFASLNSGYVYFDPRSPSLVLRHKMAKANNHDYLLPSCIMTTNQYRATRHMRFIEFLINMVELSIIGKSGRKAAKRVIRRAFASNKNYCGQSYYGIKLLFASFKQIRTLKFCENVFFFSLAFSIPVWRRLYK